MSPLDALTLQRLRSLEIVLAWLIEQSMVEPPEDFAQSAIKETYILELADKIQEAQEDG